MSKFLVLLLVLSCTKLPQAKTPKYHRKHWKHWTDSDRDCQNTRQEILIARTLAPVSFDRKRCRVMRGKWNDYYFPEVHTIASRVDIDHLVPLKHAHLTGGAKWSKKEKEAFANDPENLVITYKKYNRQKGPKGIDEWLPLNHEYACKYIKDWLKIKEKYQLTITPQEQFTVNNSNCL